MPSSPWPRMDPALRQMLEAFRVGVQDILRDNLVGLYVMGSLIMGDFAPSSSDVDFLAVTREPVRAGEIERLATLHGELARRWSWGDRLEGGYAAQLCLRPWGIDGAIVAVEQGRGVQAEAPSEYTAENMLALRDTSATLCGPEPRLVLPPVDRATFDAALRAYLAELVELPDAAQPSPPELASRALNIARCLYGLRTGRPCTKSEAAAWLARESPTLEPILSAALSIRRGEADPGAGAILRTDFTLLRRIIEPSNL